MGDVKELELKIFSNGLNVWVKVGEIPRINTRNLVLAPGWRVIYI